MAFNCLPSRKYAAQLKELWDRQGGRCAYTGEKLVPGVNASIDHVEPIELPTLKARREAMKGKDPLKSFQWVTKTVNRAKTNMTHREFVRMCKVIAARF